MPADNTCSVWAAGCREGHQARYHSFHPAGPCARECKTAAAPDRQLMRPGAWQPAFRPALSYFPGCRMVFPLILHSQSESQYSIRIPELTRPYTTLTIRGKDVDIIPTWENSSEISTNSAKAMSLSCVHSLTCCCFPPHLQVDIIISFKANCHKSLSARRSVLLGK